jgi:hypothetical protein
VPDMLCRLCSRECGQLLQPPLHRVYPTDNGDGDPVWRSGRADQRQGRVLASLCRASRGQAHAVLSGPRAGARKRLDPAWRSSPRERPEERTPGASGLPTS